ncbi:MULTISPECIES: ABC transporter ATP-binding protein [Pseudoalteromonas]|uniref:ATP-binding cassette domain-containing protein n=1 Tax=Pseudoalteromonas rubra TaxID=43658 RepID=A0A5S3UXM8_9GAMM|nr:MULTISPECIES: ABC transporter ATP-binding protein [Pseudoalteromonas]MCG7563690.1 ABC transporter ATP-binding protein/permease [Pseudoalteromonas sp. McH1-42]MEC4090309.1 ABC transporter ATP-binding protein [Pseudoalteromonas rubra]QPB85031.1 ATP-binding cassette domain-containing protein [Pseudoalteromonas rubra]
MKAAQNQQESNLSLFKRLSTFLYPYKYSVMMAIFFVALSVLLNLSPPLIYKEIIDSAIPNKDLQELTNLILISIGILVLSTLSGLAEELFISRFGSGFCFDIRCHMYQHIQRLPLSFFSKVERGELLSRFNTDLINIQVALARTIPSIITNVITLILAASFMLYMNWQLTLISIVTVPVYFLILYFVTKAINEKSKDSFNFGDQLNSKIAEDFSVNGFMFSRLNGIGDNQFQKFSTIATGIRKTRVTIAMLFQANRVSFSALSGLGIVFVYYFAGKHLIQEELTIGTLVAFTVFTQRLYQPIGFLSHTVLDISSGVVSLRRLYKILDMAPESRLPNHQASDKTEAPSRSNTDYICLDNVSFCYTESEKKPVLKGLSMSIAKGERVAFVGGNGAGKSTLALLLSGMLPVQQGEIRIGDLKVNDASADQISEYVNTAVANAFFFNASIFENVRMVYPNATDEAVYHALEKANCTSFISKLPQGVDTLIGQDGYQLSSGQRQRLSVARLFLKNSPIFILDEVTSNLDVESEHEILKSIDEISESNTVIIITHSLETISKANRIFMIDQGKVVKEGSLDYLIKSSPEFRKIFNIKQELAEEV